MVSEIKVLIEQEYIDYTKDVLRSSKDELPTFKLQLISLVRFMRAAGYAPVDEETPIRFKLVEKKDKFPLDMNLVNAVKLHNFGFFYETENGYVVPSAYSFARTAKVLEDACKQKVLKEVFLNWSKKRKEWIVNKNLIQFKED